MIVQDKLIYYYLISKQYIKNLYDSAFINVLGFNEIKIIINDKRHNMMYRYITYVLLSYISTFINILKNRINISADKFQITKIDNNGEKTIIIDSVAENNTNKLTFDDVIHKFDELKTNSSMLNFILMNFELVNSDVSTVCLKNLVVKYKDTEYKYNHTLKNILFFNDIDYFENSIIKIRLVKNKKIINIELPINDIINKHINAILESEN
jgi:hypothetical protein